MPCSTQVVELLSSNKCAEAVTSFKCACGLSNPKFQDSGNLTKFCGTCGVKAPAEQSTAAATEIVTEGRLALFQGTWKTPHADMLVITGTKLTWKDGHPTMAVLTINGESLKMKYKGVEYRATIDTRGTKLNWTVGDVWTKISSEGIVKPEGVVEWLKNNPPSLRTLLIMFAIVIIFFLGVLLSMKQHRYQLNQQHISLPTPPPSSPAWVPPAGTPSSPAFAPKVVV